MSTNRHDLTNQMNALTTEILREKGYISFVELLIPRMGKLTQQDYEAWRNRKVPYLEKVVTINLAKIGILLRALHTNNTNGGLRPDKERLKNDSFSICHSWVFDHRTDCQAG